MPPQTVIIYQDDLVLAKHAWIPEGEKLVYLGWLIVELQRSVTGLAGLLDEEAAAVGKLIARLSRALEQAENAEHVYLFVIGHHAPHLHLHIVPRYPNTPREYWGLNIDEWPDAPKGDIEAVNELAARLQVYL